VKNKLDDNFEADILSDLNDNEEEKEPKLETEPNLEAESKVEEKVNNEGKVDTQKSESKNKDDAKKEKIKSNSEEVPDWLK